MRTEAAFRGGVVGLAVAFAGLSMVGCAGKRSADRADFLSDYSKLEEITPDVARYTAEADAFRGYNGVYVVPVEVVPKEGGKLASMDAADQAQLAQAFRGKIKEALTDHYYPQFDYAGAGIATMRVAITEVNPESGRVSVEGELVDSVSGEQLMAGVVSRTWWGTVDRTMDRWSDFFVGRLDAVAPRPPVAAGELPEQSGFLSNYANLQQAGPSSLRYIEPNNRLASYSKFIVLPVESRMYAGAEEGVTAEEAEMLEGMMEDAIKSALAESYEVVDAPGVDVAEVRIALTDLKRSADVLNAVPRLKITDLGLGGLAMEGEVLDSFSGVQIAALVESIQGKNLSWNPTEYDDAEGAMGDLASRLVAAIDLAHEKAE
ncbi:MAG: DUF3313 family protein [Planctomycetota bacterium]